MVRRGHDEVATQARVAYEARSGIEWLRAVERGELVVPGAVADLGVRLVEVDAGRVVCEMTLEPRHLNAMDLVFGGTLAAFADMAAGLAVISILPEGTMAPTLEVKVNFVRPATLADAVVRAEATVLSTGRTTALAQVRVVDREGRLLAFATSTAALVPMTAGDGPDPR